MAIPGSEGELALSIPTQSGKKGLLDRSRAPICRSAVRHETLAINSRVFWNQTTSAKAGCGLARVFEHVP
jgi:hypothetical protein